MKIATQQFPVQKTGAPVNEPRRDRGADNKRLPCIEAAPVAFNAPIARHASEVHETSNPTRDGDGVPKSVSRGQLPGCLPDGYNLDSLLTVSQFAIWRQKSEEAVRAELPSTKGVINRNRKDHRIHPRTYLELSVKGAK
jgi:hypothetical protein